MDDRVPPPSDTQGGESVGSPLELLLEVQAHDTVIDQLRHRLATLPERASLRQVEARLSAIEQRTKATQTDRDELATRQAGIEQQIESSKARKKELERRMYGGQVTSPRDLQAMDDEIKHLSRHISELEDREIEVIEALEPLEGELQAADVERDSLDNDASRFREAIDHSERETRAEVHAEEEQRAKAAKGVPSILLTRYDQLRNKLGGTGAARLVGNSCGGCHLTLPAMEIDRIRKAAPDAVITCDQCGRILVR